MFKCSHKTKVALVLVSSFLLIFIINIITEELFLRKIYYFFASSTLPLYCYRISSQSLPNILDVNPPKGKSIFFHETSCNSYKSGKIVIENRQACAIESAAKLHSNRSIYVLYTSPGVFENEQTESDDIINALLTYKNVNFLHVNVDNYTKNTPIENLYKETHIEYSDYAQSHMSDLLRYVTLWKYGGIYLDLDVVVIKPFTNLPANFAGAESEINVASGVLGFGHNGLGHIYATACLNDLKNNYKFNDWGYNGPGVITRLLQNLCNTEKAHEMLNKDCEGFKVYPSSYFYPIPWVKWQMYFDENDNNEVLRSAKNSYTIHVWNKHSVNEQIPLTSNVSYVIFAKKFCPRVYEASRRYF